MTKDRFEKLQDMLDTEFEDTLDDLIDVDCRHRSRIECALDCHCT